MTVSPIKWSNTRFCSLLPNGASETVGLRVCHSTTAARKSGQRIKNQESRIKESILESNQESHDLDNIYWRRVRVRSTCPVDTPRG